MEKLNLPMIKGKIPPVKWLSMEEYLEFVNFNLKYTLNKKAYKKWKRLLAVNVPFSIE